MMGCSVEGEDVHKGGVLQRGACNDVDKKRIAQSQKYFIIVIENEKQRKQ